MNDKRREESSNPAVCDDAGFGSLLDHLHELLQRQLVLVRQGHLAAAVALFDETDQCVRQLADARGLEGDPQRGMLRWGPQTRGAAEKWQGIERAYQELSLVLAAQRTEVSAALDAAQRGRSTLKLYGSPLASR